MYQRCLKEYANGKVIHPKLRYQPQEIREVFWNHFINLRTEPLSQKKTSLLAGSLFPKPAFPRKLLLSGSPAITSERFRPSSLLAEFAGSENRYFFL
jgi:hypothetical protein